MFSLLMAALLMSSLLPGKAFGQAPTIPLGAAAQFGLLSGGYVTASAPGAVVLGTLGAATGFSGALEADSGPYWPGGAPSALTTAALADLASAHVACTGLPDQQILSNLTSQTLGAGTYALAGNVMLAPGTMLRLVGDSASRIVFNITGSLTVGFGAGVILDGIRPGQVFWNISGPLVANGPASLSGIVLGGSGATLNGRWSGDAALLIAGNVSLTQLSLDGELAPAYFTAAPRLAWRRASASAPAATTPCQNLIVNGDCEQFVSFDPNNPTPTQLGNVGSRQANRGSEAAFWQNPNEESPEYFRPGGNLNLSIPLNTFNNNNPSTPSPARSGQSYLGIYSVPQPATGVPRREYVWQRLGTPLTAGQRYYAEFYALRAPATQIQMQALGLAIRAANVADPYEATGVITTVTGTPPNTVTTTTLTSSILGNGVLPVAASDHDASFNSTTTWSRTAGCYLAQGGERDIIIGNFRSDAASGFSLVNASFTRLGAYYYIDDISLFPFPAPIIVSTGDANCRLRTYTLDMDCLLPTSSNATYAWFINVNGQLQPQPLQTGTQPLIVTPLATTTYTLVTTVPGLGGAGPTEDRRDITITVPSTILLAGILTGGANYPAATYYVSDSEEVTFTQGTYTFAPGSLILGEGLKSKIVVGTNATLIAQATTFTAACNKMWNGILVKADAKGFCIGRTGDNMTSTLPATANYNQQAPVSEISHAEIGVRWENPTTVPIRILHTRFLHNLKAGISTNSTATTAPAQSAAAIMNNQFESLPNQFKTPETDNYTHVALDLGGWNYANIPIAGNRIRRCIAGIVLRNRTSSSVVTIADKNDFLPLMVGVWAQTVGGGLTVNGNRFGFDYPFPSAYPISAALFARFNTIWPGVGTGLNQKITGMYVYGSPTLAATLTVTANEFRQGISTNNFTQAWSYPQRGAVVEQLTGPYVLVNNLFENLETGLSLGLAYVGDAVSKVASNRFYNNNQNLALFRPGGPPPASTPVFWAQCNTFRRTGTGTLPSTGISVASGLTVVFDNWEKRTTPFLPNFPAGRPWQEFMKNRFDDQTGANQRMRYLTNGNTASIRYTAYGTQSGVPYTVNLLSELATSPRQTNIQVNAPNNPTTSVYTSSESCTIADGLDDGFNPLRDHPADSTETVISPSVGGLGLAIPNPATDEVRVAVQLPVASHAYLVVRNLFDGQIVMQLPVDGSAKEAVFSVAKLRNEVYTYSVVADKTSAGRTQRLLVNHDIR